MMIREEIFESNITKKLKLDRTYKMSSIKDFHDIMLLIDKIKLQYNVIYIKLYDSSNSSDEGNETYFIRECDDEETIKNRFISQNISVIIIGIESNNDIIKVYISKDYEISVLADQSLIKVITQIENYLNLV